MKSIDVSGMEENEVEELISTMEADGYTFDGFEWFGNMSAFANFSKKMIKVLDGTDSTKVPENKEIELPEVVACFAGYESGINAQIVFFKIDGFFIPAVREYADEIWILCGKYKRVHDCCKWLERSYPCNWEIHNIDF